MAVDTRNKRFSLLGLALTLRVLPDPDGDIANKNDRAMFMLLYHGIDLEASGEALGLGSKNQLLRRRRAE